MVDFNVEKIRTAFTALVAILILFSIAAVVVDQVTYAASQTNPNSTLIANANQKAESNFNYLGILITFTIVSALAWVAMQVFGEKG